MKRYPGIRPFTADDAHLFKGRYKEKRDLFELIVLNNIVVLFGKSGIGKSSLLNAGVCPQLEDRNLHPVFIRLNNTATSPEDQVYEWLHDNKYIPSNLPKGLTLWEYFEQFWYVDLGEVFTPVIVLDQFEELFTLYTPKQRQAFIDQFADIVNGRVPDSVRQKIKSSPAGFDKNIDWEKPPKVKFVLSIRSDYLYLLDELSAEIPSILRTRFQLQLLKKSNAIEAITLPAAMKGNFASPKFNYSEGALTEVIDELGKKESDQLSGDLPESEPEIEAFQLQLFCQHLENKIIRQAKAENFSITPDFYGGKKGIKTILKEFYAEVLSRIPSEYQDAVETLMANNLIRNKRRIIMEESAIIADTNIPQVILDQLHEERVLRKEARAGQFYYEISHDTLVDPVLEKYAIIAQRLAKEEALARQKELEEANRKAEEERQKAAAQAKLRIAAEENEKKARQRTRIAGGAFFIALLLAALSFWSWQNAKQATKIAQQEKQKAELKEQEAIEATAATMVALKQAEEEKQKALIANNKTTEALKIAQSEKDRADYAKNQALRARIEAEISANSTLAYSTAKDNPTLALRIAEYNKNNHPGKREASAAFHEIFNDTNLSFYKSFPGHSDGVTSVAFSPDGNHFITGSKDKTAKLWNINGQEIKTFKHQQQIYSVAFSPSEDKIATASIEGIIKLWDINSEEFKIFSHPGVTSIAFNYYGDRMITGGMDKTIKIWDLINEEELQSFKFKNEISKVLFHEYKNWFLISDMSKSVQLRSENGDTIASYEHAGVTSIAVSPDGMKILTGGINDTIKLWDIKGEELQTFKHDKNLGTKFNEHYVLVAFSPDGKHILTGSKNKTVKLWDLKGTELRSLPHTGFVSSIAFSPNAKSILTGSMDNSIQLWHLNDNVTEKYGHEDIVISGKFSPDGKNILTGSFDKTAKLWNLNGNEIRSFNHDSEIYSVAFSPDGKTILTGHETGATLWDRTGKELKQYRTNSPVVALAFSPNGKKIITANYNKTAKLWDIDGNELKLFSYDDNVMSIVFSPDGKNILTGSFDKTVRLWNLSGKEIQRFDHEGAVRSVAFSPNGKTILTGSNDRTTKLWDLNGNQLKLFNHDGIVMSAVFSPDGKKILTGSFDKTVKLWNLSGELIHSYLLKNKVYSAEFSPDGKSMIIGNGSGNARILQTPQIFLDQKINKFTIQELYDASVILTPKDLKKVKQKEK